jgi:hypothetical protein
LLWSEDLAQTSWLVAQLSVTANATTSPDGTQNADKIAINNGLVGGYIYQSQSTTSSTIYTGSFFVKSAGIGFTKFWSSVSGSYCNAIINLSTGVITNGASPFPTIPTATNFGNGWWRVSYTETSGGGSVPIYVDGGSTSNGGDITGNGTDGIYLWGAQLEASSYFTSYIPTTSASATRVRDLAYKTSATALIGQTEGVLFCDFNLPSIETSVDYPFIVNLFGSTGYRFGFARYPNGGVHIYMQNNFSAQFTYNTTQLTGRFKLALGYKANDCVIYLNGTLLQTITSATIPATSGIAFNAIDNNGDYNSQSQINQCALFKTRLTNAELASLTTI